MGLNCTYECATHLGVGLSLTKQSYGTLEALIVVLKPCQMHILYLLLGPTHFMSIYVSNIVVMGT